jgi:hypothetical protein
MKAWMRTGTVTAFIALIAVVFSGCDGGSDRRENSYIVIVLPSKSGVL